MAPSDPAAPYLIEFVEVRPGGPRIRIAPCPGSPWFPSARERWEPDLGADLDAIAAWGAAAIVTLVRPGEAAIPALDVLRRQTEARGMRWQHAPIDDGGVPDAAFEAGWRDTGAGLRSRAGHQQAHRGRACCPGPGASLTPPGIQTLLGG
jgi:ADP-ribosyl-[dinitrogen reductase] hydrolase